MRTYLDQKDGDDKKKKQLHLHLVIAKGRGSACGDASTQGTTEVVLYRASNPCPWQRESHAAHDECRKGKTTKFKEY